MNGFRKLQKRLQEEGWYIGWGLMCCQSCAWADVPYKHEEGPFIGQEVNLDKVLFNHKQDCEMEPEPPEGLTEEEEEEWWDQFEGFDTYSPEEQSESMFCFSGNKKGVENLNAILPIIEECGCSYNWDGTGKTRIEISWNLK